MTAVKTQSIPGAVNATAEFDLVHRRLGKVSYTEEDLVFFPQGLLGFEKNKHYILVDRENYYPFTWMVSIDAPDVSFLMVNPLTFVADYNPNISRRELNELEIDNPQSLKMYVIVTLKQDIYQSTTNLSGPILLNMEKRIGKQLVLLDDSYSTKHRILKPE